MGAGFVIVVLVVLALLAVVVMLFKLNSETNQQQAEVQSSTDTLTYRVPEGQDPAAVIVALTTGGFPAVTAPGDTHTLVIDCPLGVGKQRDEVRTLIENDATLNLEGDAHEPGQVRFADE